MIENFNSIIHIGAGKCGSSALQHYLSNNPDISAHAGRNYKYVTIDLQGRFWSGEAVTQRAARSPFGYDSCVDVRAQAAAVESMVNAEEACKSMISCGDIPVLSCEGWANAADVFRSSRLLEHLGLKPRILFFVRPQVDWFNSAWWQWGAWAGVPLERWVTRSMAHADWNRIAREWSGVPNVESVAVRFSTTDVVEQFLNLIDAPSAAGQIHNVGLSPDILRFFQRHRTYRSGPHDSRIDFILGRWVKFSDTHAPWVLDAGMQSKIINAHKKGNKMLLDLLDNNQRAEMEHDPRWWDVVAYESREIVPVDLEVGLASADSVISCLIDAIVELDGNYRKKARD